MMTGRSRGREITKERRRSRRPSWDGGTESGDVVY
jgi:hypothetical protein